MSKDTFYFSHDYNARTDNKIKKLLSKHSYAGYGMFWAIIEDLYNNENKLPVDYEMIAYDLHAEVNTVKSIINDFDLFIIKDDYFNSLSVESRLNERNLKSKKGLLSASTRWADGNEDKRVKAVSCIFYIIKIYSESEQFIKVGITTESVARRYSGKLNGYKYDLLFSCESSLDDCIFAERQICENFERYDPLIKFAGHLESIDIRYSADITEFAMQHFKVRNVRNAIKESKVKESKGKENKITVTDTVIVEGKEKEIAAVKDLFIVDSGLQMNWKQKGFNIDKYQNGIDLFLAQKTGKVFKDFSDLRTNFLFWMPNYERAAASVVKVMPQNDIQKDHNEKLKKYL